MPATDDGATSEERLRAAAKLDDEGLCAEVLAGAVDVNKPDGMGYTALHLAASHASPTVLELILEHEGTDVDLLTRIDRDTPLHLACRLEHPKARLAIASSLLEAGADPRIANKHKERPIDLLRSRDDDELRSELRRAEGELNVDMSAIATDDDGPVPASGYASD